ncbi:MAG: ATP-binding cassette domain-containing protein, partial [Desulfobacteraceae bacterium]|nr:ATP-binding cassette domain-containing protein [Desulfobacteraceae bacterium]
MVYAYVQCVITSEKGDYKIARLEIHDIHKTFGEGSSSVTALENLNLMIGDEELCCIIGPSGCGKTTLLRIIGGFYKATSGSVKLDGVEISEPGADRGVVFQEYALFPWMTVMANAEFGLRMKGIRKADRRPRVEEYLQMVGLS